MEKFKLFLKKFLKSFKETKKFWFSFVLFVAAMLVVFNIPLLQISTLSMISVILLSIGLILFIAAIDNSDYEKYKSVAYSSFMTGGVLLGFIIGIWFVNSPIFWAKKYASLIKVKEVNASDIVTNKIEKIRSVTKNMAIAKANKILGVKINGVEVNTQFQLSDGSIIKYKGKQYWVFSLEPSGFFKWISNAEIPGYVLVSATDPKAKAVFVKKAYKIGNSYLWNNINRIAYLKTGAAPFNIHFEIDESGNPVWVVVKLKYAFVANQFVPDKVLLINAQTGKTSTYDYNKVPSWVDKTIPEKIAQELIEYNGKYSNGFWNSVFTQRNVVIPTDYNGSELWLIENKKGELSWFTGLTSVNKKDNSLTSAIALNSKTLDAYKIIDANGVTDESGAIEAIDSALGANSIKWQPVLPMPLIINGKWYWVASIINTASHLYQAEGAVQGNDITNVIIAKDIKNLINKIKSSNTTINNNVGSKAAKKRRILQKIEKMEKELQDLKEMVKTL